ncbi:MAG: hypothetical protein M0015_04800 [Betaproteobacteria bacterium]|nr:hypothetical protein [Betaproteobacteria bacterium]
MRRIEPVIPSSAARLRRSIRAWLAWAALATALNALWEIGQLPLYAIFWQGSAGANAWAVVHCTAGDALIAAAVYALAALAARDAAWPWSRPWRGLAVATLAAVSYTIFSERYSVYVAGRWAYAPAMPLVFGIGLAPLAQWALVPGLTLALLRRFVPKGAA